ncbi:hypothetical protein CLU85_4039 [Acidovorax sp. 69]|uniref:hypothetical protein n=1 Tax=Acidovorax sp. 69 TaxID=2035202 RepID=UPI000C250C45|nr:hypothetical protein [Acidovorax sp. 69]PJI99197.1 hypothetical protein CLU85_4039 [Acidovorax sp. 69]
MKKYSLHVLVFINVALALVLASLWIDKSGHLRNIHWKAPPPQTVDYASMVPVLPRSVPTDTGQFIAMLDRPVFSPTRRPPPPPPPPEEKAPVDNLSTAQLSGLFQGGGDGGVIIQIAGKHKRVRLREVVEGWTLSAIQDRSVTFTLGGQSRVLQLPRAALTSYTGLPPAAGSAAPSMPRSPVPAAAQNVPLPSVNSGPVQPPAVRATGRPLQPVFGGSASQ